MKYFAITLPALALLAACGGSTETSTTATNTVTTTEISTESNSGTNNAMIATPAMTGQQFADAAASTDAFEIAAGKLARDKGSTDAIRDFGTMMIDNHTESTSQLNAAAGAASPAIAPNPEFTPQQEADLQQLRNATGTDFDKIYRTLQIVAHQKALATLETYGASGGVPELKLWAAKTAPVVRKHLDALRGM